MQDEEVLPAQQAGVEPSVEALIQLFCGALVVEVVEEVVFLLPVSALGATKLLFTCWSTLRTGVAVFAFCWLLVVWALAKAIAQMKVSSNANFFIVLIYGVILQ